MGKLDNTLGMLARPIAAWLARDLSAPRERPPDPANHPPELVWSDQTDAVAAPAHPR